MECGGNYNSMAVDFRYRGLRLSQNYRVCNNMEQLFGLLIRRDFIIQEVYARIILHNLTRLLISCVSLPKKNTKYKQKISIADATTTCRDFLIQRFKNDEIEEMLIRYVTYIRPNRSFNRRKFTKRFIPLTNRL